ncbi:hypothetical protein [uncultured Kocuria sp.]|uniref:hypothetical protein n=1 Tax=uncultured Kocuria sp. TaxID=259305 RepID=UPI002605C954|nr:hypothetical protein [uncultured Kocuria sp.]
MIPNTDPRVIAIIEQDGRQLSVSVLAWDDRHRALVASTQGHLTAAEDLNGFTYLAQLDLEASAAPAAVVEVAPRWSSGSILDPVPTAPSDELRAQIFAKWNAGELTRDAYRVALTLLGSKTLSEGCNLTDVASGASTPRADVPAALDELERTGLMAGIIEQRPAVQPMIVQARGPMSA